MPHLVDAFKYLLPPYAGQELTLYRGELESRHTMGEYGISWTPIFEKAKEFAHRRLPDEGPVLVQCRHQSPGGKSLKREG